MRLQRQAPTRPHSMQNHKNKQHKESKRTYGRNTYMPLGKQFTNTVKHATHKSNRATHKIKGYNIKPTQVFSVVAKTLDMNLLPNITANIPNTPTHHGYKTQHSTVTVLHTLNNTVAKGFIQMVPPARAITVPLDMSKTFDTMNIHTQIRKLLQTKIPGTIIKLIANYNKAHKAYTIYRNHTSSQRKLKTGISQGGVLSPTLFNICTADIPLTATEWSKQKETLMAIYKAVM